MENKTNFKVGEKVQLTRTRTWLLLVVFGIIGISLSSML